MLLMMVQKWSWIFEGMAMIQVPSRRNINKIMKCDDFFLTVKIPFIVTKPPRKAVPLERLTKERVIHHKLSFIGWRHAAFGLNDEHFAARLPKWNGNDWWSMKMFLRLTSFSLRTRTMWPCREAFKQPYHSSFFRFPFLSTAVRACKLFLLGIKHKTKRNETKKKWLQGPMFICRISFYLWFQHKNSHSSFFFVSFFGANLGQYVLWWKREERNA